LLPWLTAYLPAYGRSLLIIWSSVGVWNNFNSFPHYPLMCIHMKLFLFPSLAHRVFSAYETLNLLYYLYIYLHVSLFLFSSLKTHGLLPVRNYPHLFFRITPIFTCTWKHPCLSQFIDIYIYTWKYLRSFPRLSTYLSASKSAVWPWYWERRVITVWIFSYFFPWLLSRGCLRNTSIRKV
jgi:hypothetical protein